MAIGQAYNSSHIGNWAAAEFLTDIIYRYSVDLMVKMQKQPMYEDTFKPEIEKLADNAKKSYASQFKAEDKKIILIGSSFDEEEKTIGEWVCENL